MGIVALTEDDTGTDVCFGQAIRAWIERQERKGAVPGQEDGKDRGDRGHRKREQEQW